MYCSGLSLLYGHISDQVYFRFNIYNDLLNNASFQTIIFYSKLKNKKMEQENNNKNSKISRMSIESLGSNFSNFSFLKDVPNKQSIRGSLKYYMSIESDKRSDIYESLLGEDQIRKPMHGSGLGKQFKPDSNLTEEPIRNSYDGRQGTGSYFNSDYSNKERRPGLPNSNISDENAKQFENRYDIMHTCLCATDCQKDCPCFNAVNDECIMGLCCPTCIEYKKKLLENRRRLEKEGVNPDQIKPCTCKKTKCNKKYCACYAAGRKCTTLCSCDECTNCDFFDYQPPKQQKPKTYIDVQYERNKMPDKMDFQPVQFPQL